MSSYLSIAFLAKLSLVRIAPRYKFHKKLLFQGELKFSELLVSFVVGNIHQK
jgi:hypothetical protein